MGEKCSGKDLVPGGRRASTLSGEVRHGVIQLDTSVLKDMIMCPGADTRNFSGSEEGESVCMAGVRDGFYKGSEALL